MNDSVSAQSFRVFKGRGGQDPEYIYLARNAGFCRGVKWAVDSAYEVLEQDSDKTPVMYGEIIHNRSLVTDLLNKGFEIAHSIGEIPPQSRVLIRAHGVSPTVIDEIENVGHELINRSCPYVLRLHRLVRSAAEAGKKIFLVGDANHPEILGVIGAADQVRQGLVELLGSAEDAAQVDKEPGPAIVLAQTTFSREEFDKIKEILSEQIAKVEHFDTICSATEDRQVEARELARASELVLVVGGRHSSNTQRLYDLCRRECGETYLIEDADDLEELRKTKNFSVRHLGVTAGASTPDSIIMEVIHRMSETKQGLNEGEEMIQDPAENREDVEVEVAETAEEVEATETNDTSDAVETVEESVDNVEDAPEVDAAPEQEEDINFEDIDFTEFIDNIPTLKRGQTVEGVIVRYDEENVYVDVRDKSEGKIPMREFMKDPDFDLETAIAERQPIEVYVRNIRSTDHGKEILLSKARVDFTKYKDLLQKAFENEEVVSVKVFKIVRDGVIATYGGIDIYIHRTQLEMHTVEDLDAYRDTTIDILITQFDDSRRRLRVSGSRRSLLNKMRRSQAEAVWDSIEVGDIYEGIVRSLTNFGVFVDIGGVDGLVHISELSWDRIDHPSDVVAVGDKVQVYVKDFDRDRDRISLGYKRSEDDPYSDIEGRFPQGSIVSGKVVRMFNFGAFVEIAEGVDALCHISQISSRHLSHPSEVLKEGQTVEARVLDVNNESRRISISIKAVAPVDAPATAEAAARQQRQEEEFPTSYSEDSGSGADMVITGSGAEEFFVEESADVEPAEAVKASVEEPVDIEDVQVSNDEMTEDTTDDASEEADDEVSEEPVEG